MRERARALGVELERRPAERVVITGFAQRTPLGSTEETWQKLLRGESGIKGLDVGNFRTNIGAPVQFNPEEYFETRELKQFSRVSAMAIVVSREALEMSDLLGPGGKLDANKARPDRVGSWISSGIAATYKLIDVHETIHTHGSRRVSPFLGLQTFPEQINGQVSVALGNSGWGGNTIEACATGASNIVEGARTLRLGDADIVIAGGFEEPLTEHGDVSIGVFAAMRAVSARNDEPQRASRPFDRDRDGFVLGAGGGVVILERLDHALERRATVYGELLGFEKSMDGYDPTELNPRRVAKTIAQTIYDKRTGLFRPVDAIFAHATSTKIGDTKEAEALRFAFGDELKDIPITAIKSMLGHLAGGAGAVNAISAIQAIRDGKMPAIANLETPGEEFLDLNLVRGRALEKRIDNVLATAYGFGGYNAVLLLGRFQG